MDIHVYVDSDSRMPYFAWIHSLRDVKAKEKVSARIDRLTKGNFGKCRSVGSGVQELKVDYGSGLRIYFGRDGFEKVVLLCGGDKKTQNEDIKKAREYWAQYKKERKNSKSTI